DRDGPERRRAIEDAHVHPPRLRPVAEPHRGCGRTGRAEGEKEPTRAVAAHQTVVHDVAPLVEDQRVSTEPRRQVVDRTWVEPFEELDDDGARDRDPSKGAD